MKPNTLHSSSICNRENLKILLIWVLTIFTACEEKGGKEAAIPVAPAVAATPAPANSNGGGSDVYVAGYINELDKPSVAVLWKNGNIQSLTDGTREALAHSVYVSGGDVYVVGYEKSGNTWDSPSVAVLWKNGKAQRITDGTNHAEAYSVFVSGSDVYVVVAKSMGSMGIGTKPTVWKNGVAQRLKDGTYSSMAKSIFISGGGANTFSDARDKKNYKTVKIGNQTWMAENLNYKDSPKSMYAVDNGDYGTLYSPHFAQKACPAGWHLPKQSEWDELVKFAGGANAASALKSKSGWKVNGTDIFGFGALPGGFNLLGLIPRPSGAA